MLKKFVSAIILGAMALNVSGCSQTAQQTQPAAAQVSKDADRSTDVTASLFDDSVKQQKEFAAEPVAQEKSNATKSEVPALNVISKDDIAKSAELNRRGKVNNDLGDYDKAIDYLKEAIELNPRNDIAWNNLGFSYYRKGDHDKALEYYRKAIELNPKNDSAWNNLGLIYLDMKDYDNAIKYFREAIELSPKDDFAWNNLGWAYFYKEDYDKAIEYGSKAVEINPNSDASWYLLALSFHRKGDNETALKYINKALDIKPNDETYQEDKALILSRMK